MKKIALCIALMGVFAMVGQVWAGSSCCPYSKSKKAGYDAASCTKALKGIELTAEQQEKIAKIEAQCKADGMTVDACSKSMSQIRDVLTDDQKSQFDAATATKSGKTKAGCGS